MPLRNCLEKHISVLDREDAQSLREEARRLEDTGMPRAKAERQAVERALEDAEDALNDVRRQLVTQGVPVDLKPVQATPKAEEAPAPEVESEPAKDEPKPEPEPKAEPLQEEVTGIKNAVSAETRKRLGLPELETPETRAFEEMYEAGKKLAESDPLAIQHLIDVLKHDPEKVIGTESEAGLMLKHKVDLENGLHELIAKQRKAQEQGDDNGVLIAKHQLKEHRQRIIEFTELSEQAGTAAGRALASRKMMSGMDYSLSHMEAMAEAAKGDTLNDADLKVVQEKHEAMKAKLKAAEEQLKEANEKNARIEVAYEIERLKREAAEKLAAPAMSRLSKMANAARKRIKARGIQFNTGLDPTQLIDLSIIGAEHIAKGLSNFAKWSAKMVSEFGETIRPHLKTVFDASEQRLAEGAPKQTKEKAPPKTVTEKMKDRIDEDAEIGELQSYLRTMALDIIRSGTTEREAILDELHSQVREILPNITREETRDALSGYGRLKLLDKEEAKNILRDVTAESQKLAQLEALQKGQSPLKSGVERQDPSDKARALQKEITIAKRKAGIALIQGPNHLKSLLESAKTRVRNQINDLLAEIDTGVRIVRGKTVPISDVELASLKELLAEVREHHAEAFKKPGLTDEQRLEKATAFAKANAEAWEKRLARAKAGDFSVDKKTPVSSFEIDAIKARTEAVKAAYNNLKANDPASQADEVAKSNAAYRERVAERIANMRDRMARNDFSPVSKKKLKLDPASLKAQTEVEKVKREWREFLKRKEWESKTKMQKAGHAALEVIKSDKSIKASLDMGFILRQGWRVMFTNPKIWFRNSLKSFVDAKKGLSGDEVLDSINAEMKSHRHYQKALRAKLAIGKPEDDMPTSLPGKIPGIGRAFKASEGAMTGFQYRNRMEIFSKYLDIAEASGIDTDDTKLLISLGKVANSLTARGHLGWAEGAGNFLNLAFFSARKIKGDWDALTAHAFDSGMTPFARKQAIKNLAKFTAGTALIYMIASALGDDDTIEEDPRSAGFGKIKEGGKTHFKRYEASGGAAPIITLVARLSTLMLSHFDEFKKLPSFKDAYTGKMSQINSDTYNARNGIDVIEQFFAYKLAPVASVAYSTGSGRRFDGSKPTAGTVVLDLMAPIIFTTLHELMNEKGATPESVMKGMAADFFGSGVNVYEPRKK
jgi:hypothetical protein